MNSLDTSAFVKHYRAKEEGSDIINKLVDDAKAGNEQLVSSFIVIGEIISVFDKWVRYKLITEEELHKAIRRFLADIKEMNDKGTLILEPITSFVITLCIDLIVKYHLSINDAIHLYTALSNKDNIKEFISSITQYPFYIKS